MKTGLGLFRLAVWATVGLYGCSGPSPSAGGSDAGAAGEPDAATPTQIAGFDFALNSGDFWDYGWREERTVFAITGSSDTKLSDEFRLTLGAPGVRASYRLKVGVSSTPNDLSVTDWFSVTLASPQRIVVDATNGWGVVITNGDGSRTLAFAPPSVDAGGATATSPVLAAGTYAIGLGKTKYAKTSAYTMSVSLASQ